MKKGVKIFLVIFILLIIIIGAIGGTLFYSYKNISYETGSTQFSNHIYLDVINYKGYVEVKTELSISNDGLYALRSLSIDIKAYGYNFTLSNSLNGKELGTGSNNVGDIVKGQHWSGYVYVNLTQYISALAIEDCDIELHITINVKIDFFVFQYPLTITSLKTTHWSTPYS